MEGANTIRFAPSIGDHPKTIEIVASRRGELDLHTITKCLEVAGDWDLAFTKMRMTVSAPSEGIRFSAVPFSINADREVGPA